MPMPTTEVLARSRTQWTAAAPTWDREGEIIAASTRAVTDALLEAAAPAAGMAVLDVAGGTGDPTGRLAALVGAAGRVTCSDLTPAMLAGARRRLAGATNVCFVAASAEALPFEDDVYDAVVSRFGVMLFADPAGGAREMLRVARPGATVVAAVWGAGRWPLSIPMRAVARARRPVDAPGVFASAENLWASSQASARDVCERAFTMSRIGLDQFWPFLLRVAAPLRAAVGHRRPSRERIAAAVREDVAPHFPDGTMTSPPDGVVRAVGT
jgi:SAM-dependent methyltransferase